MNMEIETTYFVTYQERGDDEWYAFTGVVFTDTAGRTRDETRDFNEAFGAARDLYDGKIWTDSRPKYRADVSATRVVQRIYAGGTVITFGTPTPEPELDA